MKSSALRIIVTGLIAQHPTLGGVAWDYVAFPAALRRMGHDVYYFEDSGEWPYNLDGGPTGDDWVVRNPAGNVSHLRQIMSRYGLDDRWAYRFPIDDCWFGLSAPRRREIVETADLVINVSGTLEAPDRLRGRQSRLAYIDSDPMFTQVKWMLSGASGEFRHRVDAHDVHFSFGERLSDRVPETGHTWVPTRQPILLDEWWTDVSPRKVYTTVMSWTSYQPLRYGNQTYGSKDMEFRRFAQLPGSTPGVSLEVALHATEHANWESSTDAGEAAGGNSEAGPARVSARDRLKAAGWSVVDPSDVCGSLDGYRSYVQSSRGEWSVAKHGYVAGRTGWFSCRSACYLAAGRPVIVQDTGVRHLFPAQEGVVLFDTIDEARDAIVDVEARYATHAKTALAIAETHFGHEGVLNRLIDQAMNGAVGGRRTNLVVSHAGTSRLSAEPDSGRQGS